MKKPCEEGAGLHQLVIALWQRTNGVERVLGLEHPMPFNPQFPEPGALGKMVLLCQRWTAILAALEGPKGS